MRKVSRLFRQLFPTREDKKEAAIVVVVGLMLWILALETLSIFSNWLWSWW